MTDARPDATPAAPLAEVIPLPRARKDVDKDVALLSRRYGERWPELPANLGRTSAAAETLLIEGPTTIDPGALSPVDAAGSAWLVVQAATAVAAPVVEEAEVLGEALHTRIVDLPLRDLDRLAGAVLDLGVVARAEPTWSVPAATKAARTVLDAHGGDLRRSSQLHEEIYRGLTDRVLAIPEASLRAARRPWRVVSRVRVRRALVAASRTGRIPGGLGVVVRQLLEVHDARRHLTSLAPLLTTHLGRRGLGPLVDVDGLLGAVTAVQRLQRLLGDRLDEEQLAGLLAADAFRSPELIGPAAALRSALRTWQADVVSICGGDPWVLPAEELAGWAVQAAAALPALTTGARAAVELGAPPTTVRTLVDDLLLRENVAELTERRARDTDDGAPTRADAGSAS